MASSTWEQFLGETKDPWDWVAAGIGAITGGVGTIWVGASDMGTSVCIGAIAGVTGRKALAASLMGRGLQKRASCLSGMIIRLQKNEKGASLRRQLDLEVALWKGGGTNEQLSENLDKIADELRQQVRSAALGPQGRQSMVLGRERELETVLVCGPPPAPHEGTRTG